MMEAEPEILPPAPNIPALPQAERRQAMIEADTDERLIELWLHGRPKNTQTVYRRDAAAFLDHAAKPLQRITLNDLQAYQDSLLGQSKPRGPTGNFHLPPGRCSKHWRSTRLPGSPGPSSVCSPG